MKKIFLFLCFTAGLSFNAQAYSYEVSTLLGTGNARMDFVRDMVKNHIEIIPGVNLRDYTTAALYFLHKNGASSVQTIQVVNKAGQSTKEHFIQSLDVAGSSSAIVIVSIGGGKMDYACEQMAAHKEVAFLIPMVSLAPSGSPVPDICLAKNILAVGGLVEDLSALNRYEAFGPALRLAVPSTNLTAPVDTDVTSKFSNRAVGMAIAAGKMTETLSSYPELRGALLIEKFLQTQTRYLSSLDGKVVDGKALLDFEK